MVLDLIDPWLAMHIVGVVIAVGAVTVTDGFLMLFKLRPAFGKIVVRTAPVLSLIVWAGFVLVGVSGLVFVLQGRPDYGDPYFRFKMAVTGLIFLNGLVLNEYITPRFAELSEDEVYDFPKRFERIAALAAAISVLGWWTALFTAYFLI